MMSATLLSTKLSIPPLRPDLLLRPHLFERLDAALQLGHQLTLISAMAGSGKTTLVATWLQHVDQPIGWLSLDRDDNDPVCFSTHLITALQRIDGRIGQAAQNILAAQHFSAVETLMELLINDIAATPTAFVLVLDDFHLIQTPAIHAMIAFLLDHRPPQLHLVLLTREDPPLPLPRLRARGQLTELRAADLRFSIEEIARFLEQTHGLALDTDLIAALEARTEGWIAGVQLAALALQERTDVAKYIDTFSGSHRFVVEYLAADVVQRLSDDLRTFLRQTAILERLTAPLCDAVTERTDGAAYLRQIEQANLFIIPLDDCGQWYRYHHLFAEFLRSTLRAEELPTLHRRAAEWYHAQGFWEDAIEHALASHDQKLAEDLIAQSAGQAIQSGRLTRLLGWLAVLPDARVRASSDLATYKAWGLWLTGHAAAAASYAQSAGACLPSDAPPVCRGRLLGLQALLADPDALSPQLFREALDMLRDADPLFRSIILLRVAYTQMICHDTAETIRMLSALAELGQAQGDSFTAAVALSRLAMALHIHGKRKEALASCQRAIERFVDGRGQPLPVAAFAYIMAGRLAYAANNLPEAARQLQTGLELAHCLGLARAITEGKEALAQLQFALGKPAEALATIVDARAFATRMHVRGVETYLAAVEAEFQLRSGNRAAAEDWAETIGQAWSAGGPVANEWALRYRPYVRLLLARRCPQEALALLSSMARWERAGGRYGQLIPISIFQALAHRQLGDLAQARTCLAAAVGMAATEEEQRVFLDAGPQVAELLPAIRPAAPRFVDGLLEAFGREGGRVESERLLTGSAHSGAVSLKRVSLIEPLSRRESEILRLIASGMPNDAVAHALVIAPGTVKKHLDNIYGKLGAHNRTEAVARARQRNLL